MQHSTEYKQRQEDFVSNIRGTTPLEIFGLSFSVILVPLLEQFVKVFLIRRFNWKNNNTILIGLEIILKIVFYYAIQTVFVLNEPVFSKTFSINLICVWLFMIVTCLIFKYLGKVNNKKEEYDVEEKQVLPQQQQQQQHIEFLSEYRHSMQLSTIMAILMVDFTLFPRRLCKAETFGYTLMDLGVGSFVFSGAIVSSSARKVSGTSQNLSISKIMHSLIPLVCLAFFRFFTVQTVNYQTHVTEYGTHWNFFTTLACLLILSIVADFVNITSNWKRSIISGFLCIFTQQILLSYFNMQDVILFKERSNFILANKEGFGTILGYFSIHLLGVGIGQFTFSNHKHSKFYLTIMTIFSVCTILLTFLPFFYFGGNQFIESPNNSLDRTYHYQISYSFFQETNLLFSILIPSRRMTNFGYVIYTISFNITLVALFYLVSGVTKELPTKGQSHVRDSMNFNPLFSFLFANIMTGLLNLSIHTIDASYVTGSLVIISYGIIVCLADIYLFSKKRKVF
ncbi:predicted protein [Naegleria gruberi]|uniref:Predicted protein n=1 Tax=Naegleria gruberi TaxID=5762 RepID=D2UYC6_NAEGR|nr:uncharacterized protein NAEGRDRAFT_28895 [Naegleria gruberi]EFC50452.1 predicted protein [Naegleria gruberi]|eukprot:XP_002683196.1 predicted protein [Naegleria gruberi strain NEG-M]